MSKPTLDEAIKHCLEVAEKNDGEAEVYDLLAKNHNSPYEKLTASRFYTDCAECAADHRQLAEWLTELKELRNSIGAVKIKDMKEAVGLLQELNTENDQLASQLLEAKKLLKEALIIAKIRPFCDERYCDICKNVGCEWGEDCFEWKHEDEALALIGEEGENNGTDNL